MSNVVTLWNSSSFEPCESRPIERNVVDKPRPARAGRNDKGWPAFEDSNVYVVYFQPGKLRTGRGYGIASGAMCGKARRQRPRDCHCAPAFVGG